MSRPSLCCSAIVMIFAAVFSKTANGAEIIGKVLWENGKPIIINGKMAAIDKGSRDGINEGDHLSVRRGGPQVVTFAVGKVVSVFRDHSFVTVPEDRSGIIIGPEDLFVGESADPNELRLAVQHGNVSTINALAISFDGKLVASGDGTGDVAMWSVPDHRLLYSIHVGVSVNALEFSNDGNALIVASEDDGNGLKVWDVRSGRIITSLYGHKARVKSVAVSPTAPLLASESWDNTVKLWDLNTYEERCTAQKWFGATNKGVMFSNDGRLVMAPISDSTLAPGEQNVTTELRTWSTTDCHETKTIRVESHPRMTGTNEIKSLASAGATNAQVSGAWDGTVLVWEFQKGNPVDRLKLSDYLNSVSVDPTGRLVGIGTQRGDVILWNRDTRKEERLAREGKAVNCVRISKTGTLMAWGGERGSSISLFDLPARRLLPPLLGRVESVSRVIPVAAENRLATVLDDGGVRIWNMNGGRPEVYFGPSGSGARHTSVSPSGIIMKIHTPYISLWNSMKAVEGIPPPPDLINMAKFGVKWNLFVGPICSAEAPGGRYVASGDLNGQVQMFDMQTGKHWFLNEPRGNVLTGGVAVQRIVFSPDGSEMAWVDMGGNAELWALPNTRQIKAWRHHGPATSIAFSPSGKWIASGAWDQNAIVRSTAEGDNRAIELGEHSGFISDVAFSPDESHLAVAGASSIGIWSLNDAKLERVLDTGRTVNSVSFLTAHGTLVAGLQDSSVMMWNPTTGILLVTLIALEDHNWLAFTPDGFFDGTQTAWKESAFQFRSDLLKPFEPERFFNLFFQPNLVEEVVTTGKSMRQVLAEGGDARSKLDISVYRNSHLPIARIRNLSPNLSLITNSADVALAVTDNGSGVQDCRVFRNETLVHIWRGSPPTGGAKIEIPLVPGANTLKAYCFNRDGLKSKDSEIVANGRPQFKPGKAYIISVGVNTYSNPAFNLRYADSDAKDIASALADHFRKIGNYMPVPIEILDGVATKANIGFVLSRLAGGSPAPPSGIPQTLLQLTAANPKDLVVLFFAGHGMTIRDRYYLLPHDLGFEGPRCGRDANNVTVLRDHGISDLELQNSFEKIGAGENILIIDACESGQVFEIPGRRLGPLNSHGLAQLAYEKGIYILAASQSRGFAIEARKYEHGLLTYALVEEGLKTMKAFPTSNAKELTARQWLDYAVGRVPQLQADMARESKARPFVDECSDYGDINREAILKTQIPRAYHRDDVVQTRVIVARPDGNH